MGISNKKLKNLLQKFKNFNWDIDIVINYD